GSAVAIGSDSIAVVTRIRPAKTVIAKRDGECVVTKRNQCQSDLMMRLSAASPGAAWLPGIPVSPLLVRMNSDHRNARASVPCCVCLRCHTLRTMADIFDVIADGTRREILQLLLKRGQDGDDGTSVSEIVAELSVSQPTVSKHLKVLREAGLVTVRAEGQHRYYRLDPGPP